MAGPCSLLDVLHGLDAICEHLKWRKVTYRVPTRNRIFGTLAKRLDAAPDGVRETALRIARAPAAVLHKAAEHTFARPLLLLRRTDAMRPQAVALLAAVCYAGAARDAYPAIFAALARLDLADARPERFVLLAVVCLAEMGLREPPPGGLDLELDVLAAARIGFQHGNAAAPPIAWSTSLREVLEGVWACAHAALNCCVQARLALCDLRAALLERGLITPAADMVRPDPHAFDDGFFTTVQRAHLAPAPDVSMFLEPHMLAYDQPLCV